MDRLEMLECLSSAEKVIDRMFANQPEHVTKARLEAYLDRYLDRRFGPEQPRQSRRRTSTIPAMLRRRLELKLKAPSEVRSGTNPKMLRRRLESKLKTA